MCPSPPSCAPTATTTMWAVPKPCRLSGTQSSTAKRPIWQVTGCIRFPLPTAAMRKGRPGHTPGSVVLLCGEYLFCGDTLFAGSIGRTDLEGGSSAQMAESLRKLAKLPIPRETQVLPGHGEFSTFGDELDNNYFIRSAVRGNNDLF